MLERDMGERYKHLLQPLRDITVNWDLSLKGHLDEYLEKLRNDRERNAVAEDGDIIRFNFPEAAMLIQGSLQIFVRKVDYLYDAIYEAYMGISNKKKKKNAGDLNTSNSEEEIGRPKNDFQLFDEKCRMLDQMVDTSWFLQNDRRKESRDPVKVGQRRDVGKRDRFVDLPISFIPTKKSAPSVHHFQFEQNNEKVYIPQSDLFSFNAIAFSHDENTEMTVFMNTAYLELIHSFSPEYIPYLRDENNQRLQRIGPPYEIEAPIEIYTRLLELDERAKRGIDSQFLRTFYGNSTDTPEDENLITLSQSQNALRPSSVEEARRSGLTNAIPGELTDVRVSDVPALDPVLEYPPFEASFTSGIGEDDHDNFSIHSTQFNLPFASPIHAEPESKLDVDNELEFMDEYADVKMRMRPDAKDKKRKKIRHRQAIEQCRIRDKEIREKFAGQEKDYEEYKNNVAEYIDAHILYRKLCTAGSMLGNFNPSLRNRSIQALNHVFYIHEKYIKLVKAQRRQLERDQERARKKEEQKRKREREQMKNFKDQAKRRRQSLEVPTVENDENQASDFQPFIVEPIQNDYEEEMEQDDADYFGAQPDEEDILDLDEIDEPDPEYNPAMLMEREINEMAANHHNEEEEEHADDSFDDQNLFSQHEIPETQEIPSADEPRQSLSDFYNTTLDLGHFATNDPAFFDLEKLAVFFQRVQFDTITDDNILMQAIQDFWTTTNERNFSVSRQRLQQWSAHILERLDEDARHKPFEIHDYGSAILDSFGATLGTVRTFRQIVKGVNKYEISRYLLATLILANCGNVQVINDGEEWDGVGKPIINKHTRLKLLSLQRHHEVFQSEQLLITN